MNFKVPHCLCWCEKSSKNGKNLAKNEEKPCSTCTQPITQGHVQNPTFWKSLSITTLYITYYAWWWPRCLIFRWHDTQMSERLHKLKKWMDIKSSLPERWRGIYSKYLVVVRHKNLKNMVSNLGGGGIILSKCNFHI